MKKRYNTYTRQLYRINHQIKAVTVRTLDETGKQIGIMPLPEVLGMAAGQGLDVVEIAPMAQPPVVKVIDYRKFLYQLKKKKKEERRSTKKSETKEIRLGPFIDDHDLDIKLKKAREFLLDGDKVRFVIRFYGRLITRKEIGDELLGRVVEKLADIGKVDKERHMEGRQMVMIMSRLKQEAPNASQQNIEASNKVVESKVNVR